MHRLLPLLLTPCLLLGLPLSAAAAPPVFDGLWQLRLKGDYDGTQTLRLQKNLKGFSARIDGLRNQAVFEGQRFVGKNAVVVSIVQSKPGNQSYFAVYAGRVVGEGVQGEWYDVVGRAGSFELRPMPKADVPGLGRTPAGMRNSVIKFEKVTLSPKDSGPKPDQVERVVRDRLPALKRCFDAQLSGRKINAGALALRLGLDKQGRVTVSEATKNGTGNRALSRCATQAARAWRFPQLQRPKASVAVAVRFELRE